MTIARLSSLLCSSVNDAEAWLSIRPDEQATPEGDALIREAFRDIHGLRHQRDLLAELLPHYAEKYNAQCNAAIWDVAVRLHAQLAVTP